QTGGFTAEFGNAQSAIINLVTKSGGPEYSGKFEVSSDHIFDEGSNKDQVKFAFGGPLIPAGSQHQRDKFTFYLNTTGAWTDGRYKDYYALEEDNPLYDPLGQLSYFGFGDSLHYVEQINSIAGDRKKVWLFDVSDRYVNNYQANFKTKFQVSPTVKLTAAVRGDRETNLPFNYLNRLSLRYMNHWMTEHNQVALTWDHTLSPKMFYTLRASRFETNINLNSGVDRNWYFEDQNTDWDNPTWIESPDFDNFGVHTPGSQENQVLEYLDQYNDNQSVPFFSNPGTHAGNFWKDQNITYTLRSDFTYQINEIHQAKTGLEIMFNEIYKDRLTNPWEIDDVKRLPNYLKSKDVDTTGMHIPVDSLSYYGYLGWGGKIYTAEDFKDGIHFAGGEVVGYKAFPWQGAFYLQDKMEWEGMIVNAGMRLDFWYLGSKYQVKSDTTGEYIDAQWDEVTYIVDDGSGGYMTKTEDVKKFQLMVSPRLGVSHPITEKDVLHFAYNYQSQLPPMRYVFTSATPEAGEVGTNVGNPNLKPETTITYEVGVEHQMGEDYLLDVTLFYKNIYNLVSILDNDYSLLPDSIAQAGRQYWLYISEDYGSARGVELTLRKRFSNFWGGTVGYTYSWANGRNSGAHEARDNLREFPLTWDIRHNASVNVDFRIPEDEEFYLLGLKIPDKFYASLLWRIQSGAPYTPVTPDPDSNAPLETNSERLPWTNSADLRVSKSFNLFGDTQFSIFVNISNLFNTLNINYVDAKTGETTDKGTLTYWDTYDLNHDGKIEKEDGEDVTGAAIYLAGLSNPNIYSVGRRISLGVRFEW
ncbi:MAG: TonB-dependent receptor, partial [Candidatus Electryonea clarkiae]|nr:TonB-dependent receptor [Candidatus Electryonea clarkiae]